MFLDFYRFSDIRPAARPADCSGRRRKTTPLQPPRGLSARRPSPAIRAGHSSVRVSLSQTDCNLKSSPLKVFALQNATAQRGRTYTAASIGDGVSAGSFATRRGRTARRRRPPGKTDAKGHSEVGSASFSTKASLLPLPINRLRCRIALLRRLYRPRPHSLFLR